jgi:antitoxin VapB
MALSIKHPEADRLARQLAARTGETLTEAVIKALKERLARASTKKPGERLADKLRAIGKRCASLKVIDDRDPDAILGYDERGLPR